jgi:hypothetical protein
MRYLEISGFYGEANDVVEFFKANPDVKFRYLFMPTEPFNVNPLVFDNSTMYPMLQVGIKDAHKMIQLGEGRGFELLTEWTDNEEVRREHKKFTEFLVKNIPQ